MIGCSKCFLWAFVTQVDPQKNSVSCKKNWHTEGKNGERPLAVCTPKLGALAPLGNARSEIRDF